MSQKRLDNLLTLIASKNLRIHTLEERKCDSLDFYDVSVWDVKAALREAYSAGQLMGAEIGVKPK